MANCVNHPWVETHTACASCAQPFCDSCLVEFLGQRYCGACRDQRLHQMQGPSDVGARYAGTGTVDLGRWLGRGWTIIQGDLPTFALATFIVFALGILSCGIALGPLFLGLYLMVFRKMKYGHVEVGNVFDGFRIFLWAFLSLLLYTVITVGISLGLQFGAAALLPMLRDNPALTLVVSGIELLLNLVLSLVFCGVGFFFFPHIAARNVNPGEALAVSWEVFRRNPLMFALAGFVIQLLGTLGLVACFVGLLITYPFSVAATAQAYADYFGLEQLDTV